MPKVSVQLSDEVHAAVRVRAFQDGVTLNDLGRVWFEAYGLGGTVVASTETTVRPRKGDGLAAGDQPGMGTSQGQSVVDPPGGGSATPTVGATEARPAPAAKPSPDVPSASPRYPDDRPLGNPVKVQGPDWKKGKK